MPLIRSAAEYYALLREIASLKAGETIAIDTETTGLRPWLDTQLRGVSLAWRDRSAYVPVSHPDSWNVSGPELLGQVLDSHLWAHPVYHNWKYDAAILERGIGLKPHAEHSDTAIVSWLLDENQRHGLKPTAARLWGIDEAAEQTALKALFRGETQAEAYKRLRQELKEAGIKEPAATTKERAKQVSAESKRTWADLTAEEISDYAEQDARLTLRLYEWQRQQAEYARIEPALDTLLRLQGVVYRMEKLGVRVDEARIRENLAASRARMAAIEAQFEVNLASPAQLSKMIYGEWGLPVHERTDTGEPSTSRSALESLEGAHAGLDLILEHRRLGKACSAYYDALLDSVDAEGRIHPSFNETGTVSGRFSCSAPNLQTIPREGTMADVRAVFVPADGYELWSYDLSQAELRFAAALSKDAGMRAAIESGDVYQATADRILCQPDCPKDADGRCKAHRHTAKTLVLSYQYGVGARKFASHLLKGTGRVAGPAEVAMATDVLNGYAKAYPALAATMRKLAQHAEATGRLPLLHPGRFRRFISPALDWPVPSYCALNAAAQGGVAGVMNDVMVTTESTWARLGARLVLTVHDSLVFEVPPGEQEKLHRLLQASLNAANPLDIPLRFDCKPGI